VIALKVDATVAGSPGLAAEIRMHASTVANRGIWLVTALPIKEAEAGAEGEATGQKGGGADARSCLRTSWTSSWMTTGRRMETRHQKTKNLTREGTKVEKNLKLVLE
jgi:hypothetical protein